MSVCCLSAYLILIILLVFGKVKLACVIQFLQTEI